MRRTLYMEPYRRKGESKADFHLRKTKLRREFYTSSAQEEKRIAIVVVLGALASLLATVPFIIGAMLSS